MAIPETPSLASQAPTGLGGAPERRDDTKTVGAGLLAMAILKTPSLASQAPTDWGVLPNVETIQKP
jgi:hypothetical protein